MKKIMMVFALSIMFVLGSCVGTVALAEQNNPVKIWPENNNGIYYTFVIVDENTGVNYIAVSAFKGYDDPAIAITPRLNSDGTLYTSK